MCNICIKKHRKNCHLIQESEHRLHETEQGLSTSEFEGSGSESRLPTSEPGLDQNIARNDSENYNLEDDEEKTIYEECISAFHGANIEIGRKNNLVSNQNNIYILKRNENGGISSEAKDGYIYKIQTTSLGMQKVLPEQEKPYEHSCKGRWVCYRPSCPVVNRLTILN